MYKYRRQLPLNALRAFEAAARHCHLRKAADELGVTHGAVSRHIRQLEEQYGVELFDRSHNRISLTPAGKRLFSGVRKGLDTMMESTHYLNPESMSGSLVVASTPSISVSWLVRMIGEFSQTYPEVDIHLVNINPQQANIPPEVDLAVCFGRPEVQHHRLYELYREAYFPVCSPKLVAASKPVLTSRDMLSYPLLHDRHGQWLRWWQEAGIEATAPRNLYFQETFQAISAAREGFGVALVDHLEVYRDLRNGILIRLLDKTIPAEQSFYLLTEPANRMTIRAKLFEAYLQQQTPHGLAERSQDVEALGKGINA